MSPVISTPEDLQRVMKAEFPPSPEQWTAITAPLSPVVVIAGAGGAARKRVEFQRQRAFGIRLPAVVPQTCRPAVPVHLPASTGQRNQNRAS